MSAARHEHPACVPDDTLLAACRVTQRRGSGPGGQRRNKVETGVVVRHGPTGLVAQASERRNRTDNERVALRRLRLELATRVRTDAAAEPSELWRSRCRGGSIVVNPDHADYPALLAEALDTLAAAGWVTRPAADALGCSATQLVRLVRHHRPAFSAWNEHRATAGLSRLR